MVRADGGIRVWHKIHEAMDPSSQHGTMHNGGGSIIVCAVFSWPELGSLVQLNRSLTENRYFKIPADHFQQLRDFMYLNSDAIFMDDNAPCHRATIFRDDLKNTSDNSNE